MGDLGLPGSVVRDGRRGAAEGAVGGAQGRPQHHDEPEGRRQAGQLHRGLRGAARAPGRIHRRADRGASHATARAAPGTRTPRSARCTCGRSSTCARDGAREDARDRRGGARSWCASTRAPTAASTATACAAASGSRWQFGPAHRRGVPRDQAACSIRSACFDPGQIVDPPQHGRRARCSASRRRLPRDRRCTPALDWSAWNVQNDPATEQTTRARHRRRPDRRLRQGRRDVQQQRPLPQVRRRHDVPELSRHARRAAPDARPRQHAAPGAVGPARRRTAFTSDAVRDALDLCVSCKGCKRDCPTGVDMAQHEDRVPARTTRRKHGHTLKDRLIARLPRLRAPAPAGCRGC